MGLIAFVVLLCVIGLGVPGWEGSQKRPMGQPWSGHQAAELACAPRGVATAATRLSRLFCASVGQPHPPVNHHGR